MTEHVRSGFSTMLARPGLAGILYAVNLTAALLVAVPLAIGVESAVESSAFGVDLVREFDLAVWADILETSGPAFGA
ncbi:MAG: hypothetical protein HKN17_02555, partial [Rhodothermales bacterium]|nr:hypothetical protein [Rhodothermales bacterium]